MLKKKHLPDIKIKEQNRNNAAGFIIVKSGHSLLVFQYSQLTAKCDRVPNEYVVRLYMNRGAAEVCRLSFCMIYRVVTGCGATKFLNCPTKIDTKIAGRMISVL